MSTPIKTITMAGLALAISAIGVMVWNSYRSGPATAKKVPGVRDSPTTIRKMFELTLPYGIKSCKATELSPGEIKKLSTGDLCYRYLTKSQSTMFFKCIYPNIGIQHATRCSPTLVAIIARPDVVDGILDAQKKLMSIDVGDTPWIKAANADLASRGDLLLMYPEVLNKARGHECEVLKSICEDFSQMTNAKSDEDTPCRELLDTHKTLALQLIKQLDPREHARLTAIKDEGELFASIGQFVNRRQ